MLLIVAGIVSPFVPGGYRFWRPPFAGQFKIPGGMELNITRPGEYTVWYDYQTPFMGREFTSSTNLPPGLKVVITHKSTGTNLTMSGYVDGYSQSSFPAGASARRSVGRFVVSAPGRYVIAANARIQHPVVLSVREDWFLTTLSLTFGLLLVGCGMALTGVALFPVIFLLRVFF